MPRHCSGLFFFWAGVALCDAFVSAFLSAVAVFRALPSAAVAVARFRTALKTGHYKISLRHASV
jgi:hypothetical protein